MYYFTISHENVKFTKDITIAITSNSREAFSKKYYVSEYSNGSIENKAHDYLKISFATKNCRFKRLNMKMKSQGKV